MTEIDDELLSVLRERARSLAGARVDVQRAAGEVHVVAHVGDVNLAIPAARARHVVVPGPLAHVPGAPTLIVGICAVLGQLVPVADVAALLGVPRSGELPGRLVVIDDGSALLGLLVDRVEGLTTVHPDDVRSTTSGGAPAGVLAGTDASGAFVLDVEAVLADPRLWPPTGTRFEPR